MPKKTKTLKKTSKPMGSHSQPATATGSLKFSGKPDSATGSPLGAPQAHLASSAEIPFRALVQAFGTGRAVMEPYFAALGISAAQWSVLRAILRAEDEGVTELRLTDLSSRLLIRPPSVTTVIDRLERAGLVLRGPSPTDRRAKMLSFTPKGRTLVLQVLAGYGPQVERVMGGLSSQEQKQLIALLGKMQEHLDKLLSETQAALAGETDPL